MLNDDPRIAGPFAGDDTSTTFTFSFKVFADSDIAVITTDSLGVVETLELDVDYSVTRNADQELTPGGYATYPISGTPLPTGASLVIVSDLPFDQPFDIQNASGFHAQRIEDAFDRTVMQIQQLADSLDRTLRVPVGETVPEYPVASQRANTVAIFNADGDPAVAAISSLGAPVTVVTYEQVFTATEDQTVFTLTEFLYVTGNESVTVTLNGQELLRVTDYTETSTSVVTLTTPAAENDIVVIRTGDVV